MGMGWEGGQATDECSGNTVSHGDAGLEGQAAPSLAPPSPGPLCPRAQAQPWPRPLRLPVGIQVRLDPGASRCPVVLVSGSSPSSNQLQPDRARSLQRKPGPGAGLQQGWQGAWAESPGMPFRRWLTALATLVRSEAWAVGPWGRGLRIGTQASAAWRRLTRWWEAGPGRRVPTFKARPSLIRHRVGPGVSPPCGHFSVCPAF